MSGGEEKVLTWEEISKHQDDQSLWVVVHDNVYDVTSYASEHPGGIGILLEHAGLDATDDFEDVGHSSDARELMVSMKIGVVAKDKKDDEKKDCGCVWKRKLLLVPIAVIAVAGLALLVHKLVHRTH